MAYCREIACVLFFTICVFNTFIRHIKAEKYHQFGFSFTMLNHVHWFQFADDVAVITSQLRFRVPTSLNCFSVWCQWSDMILAKTSCPFSSCQNFDHRLIPTINIGESFQYLGRYFDSEMSNNNHKKELTIFVNELMTDIDLKPLHPKNKLLLYSHYVLSK